MMPPAQGDTETKQAAEDEEEEEREWVELDRPKNAKEIEESGLNGDNMMIAEVDINTKGWQIVANIAK